MSHLQADHGLFEQKRYSWMLKGVGRISLLEHTMNLQQLIIL